MSLDDVGSTETLPHVDRRRQPGEGVDDRQHPELPAVEKLVVDEVHGPDLVRSGGRRTVFPQLSLDPPLGRLVAQLQALLAIKPTDALDVDLPAFPPEQHMNPPIAVAHPDAPDPFNARWSRWRRACGSASPTILRSCRGQASRLRGWHRPKSSVRASLRRDTIGPLAEIPQIAKIDDYAEIPRHHVKKRPSQCIDRG